MKSFKVLQWRRRTHSYNLWLSLVVILTLYVIMTLRVHLCEEFLRASVSIEEACFQKSSLLNWMVSFNTNSFLFVARVLFNCIFWNAVSDCSWLGKLAHKMLKPALRLKLKTNLFSRNISYTTLVSTLHRKLSANIKMILKQIKSKCASTKYIR